MSDGATKLSIRQTRAVAGFLTLTALACAPGILAHARSIDDTTLT